MLGRNEGIINKIKEIEDSLGLDWRFSHHALRAADPGGAEVELSSGEVYGALLEWSHGREEAGGRSFLLEEGTARARVRLLVPSADEALWVMSSVADIRKSPDHASELLTQMIMGETADLLKREGEWYLVRLPDGYIGWLRSWYARESPRKDIASYMDRAEARVEANVAYVRSAPGDEGLPVSDIVAGSRVIASPPEAGYRSVLLPGERRGYLRESELGAGVDAPSRERVIERAKGYMGIPYLWGGTSPKGFDCSGLVKRVFGMEGIELPRDSDLQARAGGERETGRARPGDLLFFGEGDAVSHVAIALGGSRFIHAYGEVRINGLDPEDPLYEPKLAGSVRFARVILP